MMDDERARVAAAYDRRDALAGRYDWRRPEVVATRAAASRAYGGTLLSHGYEPLSILEVGCGSGGPLAEFLATGASRLVGIDLQPSRLRIAAATFPRLSLAAADARTLPVVGSPFDCVICSTVFSSILDDKVAAAVAREVDRVLAPGGVILWFDMRVGNPSNPDVRGLSRQRIHALFPTYELDVRSCVLLPPLARRLSSRPILAALAELARPLRSHLGGGLWKPVSGE